MVDLAELEEQIGLTIESGANAVDRGRDMFADDRPIRTSATHRDLVFGRKQAVLLARQAGHDVVAEFALQEVHQRADFLGAIAFNRAPQVRLQPFDLDDDLVGFRSADDRPDHAGFDHQVRHGAVSKIGLATWQAVGEIAVAFQVVAPAFTPERFRDIARLHDHGTRLAFFRLRQFLRRANAFRNAVADGNVRSPTATVRTPSHRSLPFSINRSHRSYATKRREPSSRRRRSRQDNVFAASRTPETRSFQFFSDLPRRLRKGAAAALSRAARSGGNVVVRRG